MNPTLIDHHGLWCASCLDYITPPEQKEEHHIYPTWATKGLPAFSFVLGDWTVPVHRKNEQTGIQCHRSRMQPHADAIAHPIIGFIGSENPQELSSLADAAWRTGHLKVAVAIHEHLRTISELGSEQREIALTHALSAAGGTQLSAKSITQLLRNAKETNPTQQKPERLLNAAIVLTCNGDFEKAKHCIKLAETALGRKARSSPILARRKLPFEGSLSSAKETVRLARSEEGAYQKRTALLLSGWTHIGVGGVVNHSTALDQFREILEKITPALISWWHRFGSLFGAACAKYLLEKKPSESLLGQLQTAQYILCCLGLKGPAIPDVRQIGAELTAGLMPSDILAWIADKHPTDRLLTRDALFESRSEWIGNEIQDDLFKSQDLLLRGSLR